MKPQSLFAASLAVILLLLAACGGSQQAVTHGAEPSDASRDEVLRIYFLDVGQGDSIVIVTPRQRVVMIDMGTRQAGSEVVDALEALGIYRVNLAVITHAHADHIGGYTDVFDGVEILRYGDPGFPHTSGMYASLLERVIEEGSDAYQLHVGQRIRIDEEIDMLVLGPPPGYHRGSRSDVNANSVILSLQYRDVDVLFMGDAEEETERDILQRHIVGDIDVLKVAHHGSAYASTPEFLEVTRPEYAVISCGAGNSYGHPSPDTVERLQRFAVDGVFRTDLHGTITLETNGDWIHVTAERAPSQVMLMWHLAAIVQ